jgi:hypothetical protein
MVAPSVMDGPLNGVLKRIADARAAHTAAESDIFVAYVKGTPLASSIGSIDDLITADTKLSAALADLVTLLEKK